MASGTTSVFLEGPLLTPGLGPNSGPAWKKNVFYAGDWKLEIARRVFGPVADFPEPVW